MPDFIALNAKAITALVTGLALSAALHFGFHLDETKIASGVALLVSLCVYLVPNKKPLPPVSPAPSADITTPVNLPPKPPTSLRGAWGIGLALLLSCKGVSPDTASQGASDACKLIEALSGDGTVQSICAVAPEIAAAGAALLAARSDAGAKLMAAQCSMLPTTSVCATNEERLTAIALIRARRGDAGAK